MKGILVQAPGLFTTVQDLGREGFGPMGVSASGAADAISLRIGNRLAGNAEDAAGLEMTLVGGAFLFEREAVIAVTGADFGTLLDQMTVPIWSSTKVKAGQTLALGPSSSGARSGARSYLCIQGGIVVEPFLGSASTHVLSGLGGFEGRALRKGDRLEIGDGNSLLRKRTVSPEALERLRPRKVLRVTDGPQSDWFGESAWEMLLGSTFRVSEQSNRMGIRLDGPKIAVDARREMITEGVSLGAIQVTPSGQPIILFVEQQTTGGYPKIANVISADFHSLGQLRPRDEVRFERIEMEEALALLREQEELLSSRELIQE
jgi:antagonist of KipI